MSKSENNQPESRIRPAVVSWIKRNTLEVQAGRPRLPWPPPELLENPQQQPAQQPAARSVAAEVSAGATEADSGAAEAAPRIEPSGLPVSSGKSAKQKDATAPPPVKAKQPQKWAADIASPGPQENQSAEPSVAAEPKTATPPKAKKVKTKEAAEGKPKPAEASAPSENQVAPTEPSKDQVDAEVVNSVNSMLAASQERMRKVLTGKIVAKYERQFAETRQKLLQVLKENESKLRSGQVSLHLEGNNFVLVQNKPIGQERQPDAEEQRSAGSESKQRKNTITNSSQQAMLGGDILPGVSGSLFQEVNPSDNVVPEAQQANPENQVSVEAEKRPMVKLVIKKDKLADVAVADMTLTVTK